MEGKIKSQVVAVYKNPKEKAAMVLKSYINYKEKICEKKSYGAYYIIIDTEGLSVMDVLQTSFSMHQEKSLSWIPHHKKSAINRILDEYAENGMIIFIQDFFGLCVIKCPECYVAQKYSVDTKILYNHRGNGGIAIKIIKYRSKLLLNTTTKGDEIIFQTYHDQVLQKELKITMDIRKFRKTFTDFFKSRHLENDMLYENHVICIAQLFFQSLIECLNKDIRDLFFHKHRCKSEKELLYAIKHVCWTIVLEEYEYYYQDRKPPFVISYHTLLKSDFMDIVEAHRTENNDISKCPFAHASHKHDLEEAQLKSIKSNPGQQKSQLDEIIFIGTNNVEKNITDDLKDKKEELYLMLMKSKHYTLTNKEYGDCRQQVEQYISEAQYKPKVGGIAYSSHKTSKPVYNRIKQKTTCAPLLSSLQSVEGKRYKDKTPHIWRSTTVHTNPLNAITSNSFDIPGESESNSKKRDGVNDTNHNRDDDTTGTNLSISRAEKRRRRRKAVITATTATTAPNKWKQYSKTIHTHTNLPINDITSNPFYVPGESEEDCKEEEISNPNSSSNECDEHQNYYNSIDTSPPCTFDSSEEEEVLIDNKISSNTVHDTTDVSQYR